MGKVLPIAAIAATAYFTGGASLAASAGAAPIGMTAHMGWGQVASVGTSLFTKANMGLALKGMSAISSVMGGNSDNQLAQMQMAQLQDQKNIREIQILQEQNELRERKNRWESTVRATGRDDPNIRRLLSTGESTFQREMRNIGITGRGDINAFNSQIAQTKLSGRTAQYSGFISAGRSLLTGAMDYNKTKGVVS
tara:strand:- start:8179 stop:8763 length:585 start_codon:yes stop_codon:yes gene_type:complete